MKVTTQMTGVDLPNPVASVTRRHVFCNDKGHPFHILTKEGEVDMTSPEHNLLLFIERCIYNSSTEPQRFLVVDYNKNMITMANGNRAKILVRKKNSLACRVSLRRKGCSNVIVEGGSKTIWHEIDEWASMPPVPKKSVRSSRKDSHVKKLLESCGITL